MIRLFAVKDSAVPDHVRPERRELPKAVCALGSASADCDQRLVGYLRETTTATI